MRSMLLALLLATAAEAEPQRVTNRVGVYPRADRRDREQAGTSAPAGPLLSILPSGASIPGGECSGTPVTGTNGEALTFSRASSALCQKADGTYATVSSNQMRASSRPGFPALYVENAATNYVLYSRNMGNSAWTKTNASCAQTAIGIDGQSSGASACLATGSSATVYQTLASPGAGVLSVFIKRVSGTGTPIGVRGSSSVFFNSSTCRNITTDAPADITSGAFVRCSFEGYESSPQVGVILANSGDAFVFDGWQDETYSSRESPTSPIFTQEAAATRAADVLSVTKPSGLTDTAGCVAARLWKPSVISGNGDSRLFWFSASARVYVPASQVVFTDGADYAIKNQSPTTATSLDIISAWSVAGIALSINAGIPATGGYGGSFLGSSIHIGGNSDGSGGVNGYIGAIRMDDAVTGCAL